MAQLKSNRYISELITDTELINWPLFSSPTPIIFILLAYLYIIYFAGPRFMKNRNPYSFKRFIQCYNIFEIVANFLLVVGIMTYGSPIAGVWRYCESFDEVHGRNGEKQLLVLWWTLLIKIIDLIETVLFVLRKKYNQISVLHTYHHISTVLLVWSTITQFTHSFLLTSIVLNSTVHVIMYSYYFLSTLGPNMQRKLLPYKHWLTILQMGHLTFLMVSSWQGFISSCGNMTVKYFSLLTTVVLSGDILLFFNFYFKSYKKSKKT